MCEYEIYNKETNEHDFVYGYSFEDVERKNPNIDWAVWEVIFCEYID